MTYDEFAEHIAQKQMYETLYTDSNGREILVIRLLDAYLLVRELQRMEKNNETTSR